MLSDSGMTADELDDRFARLEALMRAESAETRRHFEVVAEGLQLQIRVETRLDGVETRLERLETGQAELADGQRALVTEVRLLAARLPA